MKKTVLILALIALNQTAFAAVSKESAAVMKLATYKSYMKELKSATDQFRKERKQTATTICTDLETEVEDSAGYFTAEQICTTQIFKADGSKVEELKMTINITGLYTELDSGKEIYAITTIAGDVK